MVYLKFGASCVRMLSSQQVWRCALDPAKSDVQKVNIYIVDNVKKPFKMLIVFCIPVFIWWKRPGLFLCERHEFSVGKRRCCTLNPQGFACFLCKQRQRQILSTLNYTLCAPTRGDQIQHSNSRLSWVVSRKPAFFETVVGVWYVVSIVIHTSKRNSRIKIIYVIGR